MGLLLGQVSKRWKGHQKALHEVFGFVQRPFHVVQ